MREGTVESLSILSRLDPPENLVAYFPATRKRRDFAAVCINCALTFAGASTFGTWWLVNDWNIARRTVYEAWELYLFARCNSQLGTLTPDDERIKRDEEKILEGRGWWTRATFGGEVLDLASALVSRPFVPKSETNVPGKEESVEVTWH